MDKVESPVYSQDSRQGDKLLIWETPPEDKYFQTDNSLSETSIFTTPKTPEKPEQICEVDSAQAQGDQPDLDMDKLLNLTSAKVFCREVHTLKNNVFFRNRGTSSTRLQTIAGSSDDVSCHSTSPTSMAENTYAEYNEDPVISGHEWNCSNTSHEVRTKVSADSHRPTSTSEGYHDDFDCVYDNHSAFGDDEESLETLSICCTTVKSTPKTDFETHNTSLYRRIQYACDHFSLPSFPAHQKKECKVRKQLKKRNKNKVSFINTCKNSALLQFVVMFVMLIVCMLVKVYFGRA